MLVYEILAFNPFLEALNFLDCLALILPLNPKGLENTLAFYLSFVFPWADLPLKVEQKLSNHLSFCI